MARVNLRQTINNTIDEMISGNYVGFDFVGLTLLYPDKENAVKVANFLLKKGYYEQYSSMLLLNKELDLKEELERVKEYNSAKGYLSIANFLPFESMIYCQQKVMELGNGLDLVKFLLNVKNCNKLELVKSLVDKGDANALAYVVKYVDEPTFALIEQSGLLKNIEEIINSSNKNFALIALLDRKNSKNSDNNIGNSMQNLNDGEICRA